MHLQQIFLIKKTVNGARYDELKFIGQDGMVVVHNMVT